MREKIKIKWMAAYEKNTIFVENNSWTMKFLSCLIFNAFYSRHHVITELKEKRSLKLYA